MFTNCFALILILGRIYSKEFFSPLASTKCYSAAGSEPASSVDWTDVLASTTRRLLHSLRD